MAHAAAKQQDPQSRELDPSNGKFPVGGLSFEDALKINNIAIPACDFDDYRWNCNNSDLRWKLKNSNKNIMLIFDEISFCLPVVEGGRFFPIVLPCVSTTYGDREQYVGFRKGYTPYFDNTVSSSSSITWPCTPICSEHPIFGKNMGSSPLWVQTPKGTKNQTDIHNLLMSFTYYALVFIENTDNRVDLKRPGLTWSPYVIDQSIRNWSLHVIDQSIRNWRPDQNITYQKKPSPCSM
jgi:hypothetical protein